MSHLRDALPLFATLVVLFAGGAPAIAGEPAVVSNVKVLSDKTEDVSSIEAWKAQTIKPGMTEREKGEAVWKTVVRFRHQNPPPVEFLTRDGNEWCVHDPIKTFNVYGYGMCCCASSNVEALARACGLTARGRAVSGHSLPEIWWGGKWHMFDASLVTYFLDADGDVAGIDDIIPQVDAWYAANPGFKGDRDKLYTFMKSGGWRKGPAIVAATSYFSENGWLPAGAQGWYSIMHCYDGVTNYVTEYPYSQGYRVNVQLRDGERLQRNWFSTGLDVNEGMAGEYEVCANGKVGEDELRYAPAWGDLAPGRVGNGVLSWNVPLASAAMQSDAVEWREPRLLGRRRRLARHTRQGRRRAGLDGPAHAVLVRPPRRQAHGAGVRQRGRHGAHPCEPQ